MSKGYGIVVGKLRHRVILQQQTSARDNLGAEVITWTNYLEVWAEVVTGSGNESLVAGQMAPRSNTTIRMRYFPGLGTGHRILFGTRIFNIGAVNNVDERNKTMIISCVEDQGARGDNQANFPLNTAAPSIAGLSEANLLSDVSSFGLASTASLQFGARADDVVGTIINSAIDSGFGTVDILGAENILINYYITSNKDNTDWGLITWSGGGPNGNYTYLGTRLVGNNIEHIYKLGLPASSGSYTLIMQSNSGDSFYARLWNGNPV